MKNNLEVFRYKKGLLQKDIAELLDMTTSGYGYYEQGLRKPSLDKAYKLAKFYGTTIEELFFKEEIVENNKEYDVPFENRTIYQKHIFN